jgi:hypothetical protein
VPRPVPGFQVGFRVPEFEVRFRGSMLWNFEPVPGTVELRNRTWNRGTPEPNLEPWNRTWNLGTAEPGQRCSLYCPPSCLPSASLLPMLPGRPRLRRFAAASLTLLACLGSSIGRAASTSQSSSAQAPQNVVASGLERYAKGDYDDAVKQLIGRRVSARS